MSHIIFWRSASIRVPFPTLAQAAAQHGLPEPPEPPDADEAMRAAVRAAQRKLEPNEHIEPLHAARASSALTWACGTWDKKAPQARFQHLHTWPRDTPATPWARNMAAMLDGLRDEAATHADAHTIAKYLPRVVKRTLSGVPMRPGGGVYFTPRGQRVADLQAFATHVPGLTVCVVHVSAEDARTAMAPVVEDALQEEAQELLAEFRRLRDPDVLTRPTTWDKRLVELAELRSKVALFAATVGNELDTVRETLDVLASFTAEVAEGDAL